MSDETTPGLDLAEQIERILDAAYGHPPSSCLYAITDAVEAALGAKDAEIERHRKVLDSVADADLKHQFQRDQFKATVDRVKALAEDMRTWCSPHGIAVTYAQRIEEAIKPQGAGSE